jgi:nucleoside 2-deoxyribosyltransferase
VGGVRSPYVDAPTASYFGSSPGPGTCRELGHSVALDAARIKSLYSDQKQYAAKVTQSVDRAVKERFFTEADGKKMKAELLAAPLVTGALGGSR